MIVTAKLGGRRAGVASQEKRKSLRLSQGYKKTTSWREVKEQIAVYSFWIRTLLIYGGREGLYGQSKERPQVTNHGSHPQDAHKAKEPRPDCAANPNRSPAPNPEHFRPRMLVRVPNGPTSQVLKKRPTGQSGSGEGTRLD